MSSEYTKMYFLLSAKMPKWVETAQNYQLLIKLCSKTKNKVIQTSFL